MKKFLTLTAVAVALALPARAAETETKPEKRDEAKRPALTAEQKALRKELIEKYDANKNKRLDKDERAKMTPEDLKKWESAAPARPVKPAEGEKPKVN